MRTIQIKTFTSKTNLQPNDLFILSKGLNTGKPLEKTCPNCFVISSATKEERDAIYWTCYMLWQGGYFRRNLIGSVIFFIRIREIREIIEKALNVTSLRSEFNATIESLNSLERLKRNLDERIKRVNDMKMLVIQQTLRP